MEEEDHSGVKHLQQEGRGDTKTESARDKFIMKGQNSGLLLKVQETGHKTEVECKGSLLCSGNNQSNRKPCPDKLRTQYTHAKT